jgi:5-methylcytosine-specific restriction enzyme subunit McrC
MSTAQLIELTEYIPRKFEREEIDYALAETLWRKYNTQVALDFPSPKTGGKWKLTSQGWVGHIPLTQNFISPYFPKFS